MKEKKILFIGIGFYDYDKAIISELENLGFHVDYLNETPSGLTFKYANRINRGDLREKVISKNNKRLLRTVKGGYDIIFIIKCQFISLITLEALKFKNPNSKFILYLWDSIQRIPNIEEKLDFFDKIYSFDKLDCQNFKNLNFLPLFFRHEFRDLPKSVQTDYDLFFLGWYHSDRLELLEKIAFNCDEVGLSYRFILYTGIIEYAKRKIASLLGGKKLNFLTTKLYSNTEYLKLLAKSRCVVDIAHPGQTGMTMRTIEIIGASRKIITTNKDVTNYDFYSDGVTLVIDRVNPKINPTFVNFEYPEYQNEAIKNYSIGNWAKRIVLD